MQVVGNLLVATVAEGPRTVLLEVGTASEPRPLAGDFVLENSDGLAREAYFARASRSPRILVAMSGELSFVTDAAELRSILGEPTERAATKERASLHEMDRRWIGATSFVLVATSNARGECEVSPKGDPAGFVHVVDNTTLAIPERPGNKRADGFHNVLSNPHVGLLFMIPGRTDTLRISGRARLVSEAPYFDAMVIKGHRPRLALHVDIEHLFYHCAKAFMRSSLWAPSTWTPDALPSRAQIVRAIENPAKTEAELEEYYGEAYAKKLYAE